MSIHLYHPRDIALLNLVGISFYRLIEKARAYRNKMHREEPGRNGGSRKWNEETAVGYEAGWAGINDEIQRS